MTQKSEAEAVYDELTTELTLPDDWRSTEYAPTPSEDETSDWLVGEYEMENHDVIFTVWYLNSGNLQIYYDGTECPREDEWSDTYSSVSDLVTELETMMSNDTLLN